MMKVPNAAMIVTLKMFLQISENVDTSSRGYLRGLPSDVKPNPLQKIDDYEA